MLYTILADKESRSITIYLSHPSTPEWGYPVLMLPIEALAKFIKGLGDAADIILKEEGLPKCVDDFIRTLDIG